MVADELIQGETINQQQLKILNQLRYYVNSNAEQLDPSFGGLKEKLNNFVQSYLQMAPNNNNNNNKTNKRFKMVTQPQQAPSLDIQLK